MPLDRDTIQRIAVLEIQVKTALEQLSEQNKKLSDYDKLAAKTGGFLIGLMVLAAILGGQYEKLKDFLERIL